MAPALQEATSTTRRAKPSPAAKSWVVPLACAVAAGLAWTLSMNDRSELTRGVFGLWRDRWFLTNVVLTHVAIVVTAWTWLRPSRRTVLRAIAVHSGVLAVLFVFEASAVARLVDFSALLSSDMRETASPFPLLRPPPAGSPAALGVRAMTPASLQMKVRTTEELADEFGLDALPVDVVFSTDSLGFRNPRDKQHPRVLCVGDSMLVGGLLAVDELVPEQLEDRLGVEVVNVSEAATAPGEQLRRLAVSGLAPDHKLVVQFVFEGNDLAETAVWREHLQHGCRSRYPETGLVKTLLTMLQRTATTAPERYRGAFRTASGDAVDVYFFYSMNYVESALPQFHDSLRPLFVETARAIERNGGRYALVLIPTRITVLRDHVVLSKDSLFGDATARSVLAPHLAKLAADENIPFFDLTPALQEVAAKGVLPYFATDTHLNATGHRAIAEALAPWLRPLVPPPSKPASAK